jgi:CRP-like cAMP-binding protein
MPVTVIGKHQMFGVDDIALGRPYTYTLKTKSRDCKYYVVDRADFLALINKNEHSMKLR